MAIISRFFKVRRGEGAKVALMFLYCFFTVSAFIVGRIISGTLFLARSGVENLPVLYILVALVVAVATWIYERKGGKLRLDKAILFVTALFLVAIIGLWLLLGMHISWAPGVLYVFVEVMGGLLIIQFATFLNELFNSREIKRLSGFVWAGGNMANLVSFPMRELSAHIAPEHFLLIIAGALFANIIIVYFLSQGNKGLLEYAHSTRHLLKPSPAKNLKQKTVARGASDGLGGTFKNLRWYISALVAISILTVTVIDFQFKNAAGLMYTDEAALADFFFAVFAWAGLAALAVQVFFVSRILERFGILTTLLTLPVLLMLGATSILIFANIVFIWLSKAAEIILRYTIGDPTIKLMYQPLPPSIRRRAQAIDGGIVRPFAQGGAGLLIILISAVWPLKTVESTFGLSLLVGFLLIGWIIAAVPSYRAYVQALLVSGTRKRNRKGLDAWEEIPDAIIRRSLSSGDPITVVNTIDIIADARNGQWFHLLHDMLQAYNSSHSPDTPSVLEHAPVRTRIVAYLGKSGNRSYAGEILKLFIDPDEEVVAEAIQAYCSLEHERAVRAISAFLEHPHPRVKAASIAGLIQYGGLEGILHSAAQLKNMIESEDNHERRSASVVLGLIRIHSFYPSLFKLINDKDPQVRREAVIAAGHMQSPELIPAIIHALKHPTNHVAASGALAEYGPSIAPVLVSVLHDPYTHVRIKTGTVHVLQQIATQKALDALLDMLPTQSEQLGVTVISALANIHQRNPDLHIDVRAIRDVLHAEVERYYQKLMDEQQVTETTPSELLLSALQDKQKLTLKRIFGLLSLIYPPRLVDIIIHDLSSSNKQARANAMEIIDNVFDAETRSYLIPALDSIPLKEKIERGQKFFKLRVRRQRDLIESFLESDDPWLIACTLHALGENKLHFMVQRTRFFLDHEDPLLRETAMYVLAKLLPTDSLRQMLPRSFDNEERTVKRYGEYLLQAS